MRYFLINLNLKDLADIVCDPAGCIAHVMSFVSEAVLEDPGWQVPAYCFAKDDDKTTKNTYISEPVGHGMTMRALSPRSKCRPDAKPISWNHDLHW